MTDGLFQRRRPPLLIRLLWLSVAAAIAYLSLYPLTGWRLRQPSLLAFLSQGFPRYYSHADIASNVAAYVIFGLLFALGWFTRKRPWLAAVLASLAGALLSLLLESLQSYLPTRVPSLLDFSANAAGAVLGGALGALVGYFRTQGREGPSPVSRQWYEQGPTIGWALLIIWLVSQLPTQRLLFSTGHLGAWLPDALPSLGQLLPEAVGGLDALVPQSLRPLHETLVVALMICTVGVLVMDLVRSAGWRIVWITALLGVALGLRVVSSPRFESSRRLLVWLTSGAQAGLLLGALALYLIGAFQRRTRLILGSALVLLGLLFVNVAPADPFFQTTQAAAQGVLTPALTPSLRSLVGALGAFWPLLALAYFIGRLATIGRHD
jgi:VanZ family protein